MESAPSVAAHDCSNLNNLPQITLKELLSVIQTLPERRLPTPVFKSEVHRGNEHTPSDVGLRQHLKTGQIPVQFHQCNCNNERSDWILQNSVQIVMDEIISIQRNGTKLIITME